jgi:DNA-binding IclR family transcriptional regulator
LVSKQGLGLPADYGPNAPTSLQAVLDQLQAARARGYSLTQETFTAGLNAMAAPVRLNGQPPMGILTIAGPTVRFTEARMLALGDELQSFAAQLAAASGASPFFNQRASAKDRQPIYAP